MSDRGDRGGRRERRAAPRVRLLAQAKYSTTEVTGEGVVFDLSICGVRIEDVSLPLQTGSDVWVALALDEESLPIEAKGKVVRQTKTGFAVHFSRVDPRLERWFENILSGSTS